MKLGIFQDQIIKAKPEFEDVKNAALQSDESFSNVYNHIQNEIKNHIMTN